MFCTNCGSEISAEQRFCSKCGGKLQEPQAEMPANGDLPGEQGTEVASSATQDGTVSANPVLQERVESVNPVLQKRTAVSSPLIQETQPPVPSGYAQFVGIGTYLGMFIVSCIPAVGFIMAIIWALKKSNKSVRNFADALLILQFFGIVLGVLSYSMVISLLKTVLKGLANGM